MKKKSNKGRVHYKLGSRDEKSRCLTICGIRVKRVSKYKDEVNCRNCLKVLDSGEPVEAGQVVNRLIWV